MRTGDTLYLNNSGHRWIVVGKMNFLLLLPNGKIKRRKADYYEAFEDMGLIVPDDFKIKG